jgi:hypothetical protein
VGEVLLAIGAAVGVIAVVGLVAGFEPSKLPPALLNIAVYKLTFGAAAGLLAAGGLQATRESARLQRRPPSSASPFGRRCGALNAPASDGRQPSWALVRVELRCRPQGENGY